MGWVGWVVHSLHGVTRRASKLRWAGLRVTHTPCLRHAHGERDDVFRLRWAGHTRKMSADFLWALASGRACALLEGIRLALHDTIWGSRARSRRAGKDAQRDLLSELAVDISLVLY